MQACSHTRIQHDVIIDANLSHNTESVLAFEITPLPGNAKFGVSGNGRARIRYRNRRTLISALNAFLERAYALPR